jgi:hypothetical protein
MLAERRPGGRLSGKRINDFERRQILDLRSQAYSLDKISTLTNRSKHSVMRVVNALRPGEQTLRQAMSRKSNPPKSWEEVGPVGRRWLEDFECFAREALGLSYRSLVSSSTRITLYPGSDPYGLDA